VRERKLSVAPIRGVIGDSEERGGAAELLSEWADVTSSVLRPCAKTLAPKGGDLPSAIPISLAVETFSTKSTSGVRRSKPAARVALVGLGGIDKSQSPWGSPPRGYSGPTLHAGAHWRGFQDGRRRRQAARPEPAQGRHPTTWRLAQRASTQRFCYEAGEG
jgi:hypothetical protein